MWTIDRGQQDLGRVESSSSSSPLAPSGKDGTPLLWDVVTGTQKGETVTQSFVFMYKEHKEGLSKKNTTSALILKKRPVS